MTISAESVIGALPFRIGTFEGWGRWVNRQAEGDFIARYTITAVGHGAAQHAVRREFLKPDGSTFYVEETTVLLTPEDRNTVAVVIAGPKGSVTGKGYVFGNQCHYDADVAPGTRLEFTFTVTDSHHIEGLASSSHADNFTCWREQLTWVEVPAPQDYTGGSDDTV